LKFERTAAGYKQCRIPQLFTLLLTSGSSIVLNLDSLITVFKGFLTNLVTHNRT